MFRSSRLGLAVGVAVAGVALAACGGQSSTSEAASAPPSSTGNQGQSSKSAAPSASSEGSVGADGLDAEAAAQFQEYCSSMSSMGSKPVSAVLESAGQIPPLLRLVGENPSLAAFTQPLSDAAAVTSWLEGDLKNLEATGVMDLMGQGMSIEKATKEILKVSKDLQKSPLDSYVSTALTVTGTQPPVTVSQVESGLTVACASL